MIEWKSTLRTGLAGIRRNALPGVALQAFALLLVLGYYFVPVLRPAFERVATWKSTYGFLYAAASTALFGGVIPFLYLLLSKQVPPSRRKGEALFYVVFWAIKGVEVDLLYRMQAEWFGNTPTASTILCKVIVDQFGYSLFWAGPTQLLGFQWKDKGFSVRSLAPYVLPANFLPALAKVVLSNWMVWIPAVSIIYCLPLPLQIPLANLVQCFWVLLLSYISKNAHTSEAPPQTENARASP